MGRIDSKIPIPYGHSRDERGMASEHRSNYLFSSHGLASDARISPLRRALPRRLPGSKFFLSRPVSLSDFCATHGPRKFARHRSLLAVPTLETLSHGFPRSHLAQHAGSCQRASRLAPLCRFRSPADRPSPPILSPRTLGRSTVATRGPSKCTRCWTCAAAFRPVFM